MRRFNFNAFNQKPEEKPEEKLKPRYSAYRTVISRHETSAEKLKNEPIAVIKND